MSSLCGFGGVLRARRIASSRLRAISSSEKSLSSGCLDITQNQFDGPRLLIERAREHLGDLKRRGQAFADSKPYARFCDFDSEAGEYVHGVRVTAETPMDFTLVVADVLNNLKSALDQAVCASVSVLTPDKSLDGVCFPFGNSVAHYESARKLGRQKVSPEVVTVIDMTQPYKGGNNLLWGMNAISKMNRHRMVQPVLFAAESGFGIRTAIFPPGTSIMVPVWDSSKNELIFFRTKSASLQYDLDVAFYIAFGDVEIMGGKPAIPALHGFSHMVEDIVGSIEAQTTIVASRP